jgi:hypothetical protein
LGGPSAENLQSAAEEIQQLLRSIDYETYIKVEESSIAIHARKIGP